MASSNFKGYKQEIKSSEFKLTTSFAIQYRDECIIDQSAAFRLPYNRIIFIQDGQGILKIDDRHFEITGNTLILLAKGQVYQFATPSLVTGYDIAFEDFFWEKAPASASNCKSVLFDNAATNQIISLNQEARKEISPLFQILLDEYNGADYTNKADALAAYMKVLMIKAANITASMTGGYNDQEYKQYRKFYDLITRNFMVSHEVDHYACQLGIPSRKLTAMCKRYSGKGAKDLINRQLMTEAKRALQFSSIPVKEIAYQLNFNTPEQFSHFFKKNASHSPQRYRTEVCQN